jgi:hypothetical protein
MPVGRLCSYCEESIQPQDAGFRVEVLTNLIALDALFQHRECFVRQIVRSAAHIEERCSCCVPGAIEGDDPGLTRRQGAKQAVDAWRRKYEWNDPAA